MAMQMWADEFDWSMSLPWQIVMVRIFGSMVLTGLIGFQRARHNSSAGLRTHMMVGLASTTYCLITLEMVVGNYNGDVKVDPIRIVEAVTGGVAFLAAGMIVFSKGEVRGLTTGASLWLAASIGLAAGLGLWPLAIGATVLGLLVVGLAFFIDLGRPSDEKD